MVSFNYEKRVPSEGMPSTADPSRTGDLVCALNHKFLIVTLTLILVQIIRFKIVFPSSLPEKKKALVREALA